MNRRLLLVVAALSAGACRKDSPPANPKFNDAIHQSFVGFRGPEADLAFALRALQAQLEALPLGEPNVVDRSVTPEPLTVEDVAGLERPEDLDPADALPIAVAGLSAFGPDDAAVVQLLPDQRPVEPYSPDKFDRIFLEGGDCWLDRGCEWLLTLNDLVKKNLVMEVPYEFLKDFRWVDLNLPDPADVPEGEEAVNEGEPRWAIVAQSWQAESFTGDNGGTTLAQSFTVEVWLPRDDGGTTRMNALWSDTELSIDVSDDTVIATARGGIDRNFQAQEEWLEENAR
jgi:hypothetical protein